MCDALSLPHTHLLASDVAIPDLQVCILTDSEPLKTLACNAGLKVASMKVSWRDHPCCMFSSGGRAMFVRIAHLRGVRAG